MQIDISQLKYLDPKLRQVLLWVERESGLVFRITSQLRIEDIDGGKIHGTLPLRATDLGCKWVSVGKAIEKEVNKVWTYDPDRPRFKVCKFHGPEVGQPWHLHFQVHSKTRKRR